MSPEGRSPPSRSGTSLWGSAGGRPGATTSGIRAQRSGPLCPERRRAWTSAAPVALLEETLKPDKLPLRGSVPPDFAAWLCCFSPRPHTCGGFPWEPEGPRCLPVTVGAPAPCPRPARRLGQQRPGFSTWRPHGSGLGTPGADAALCRGTHAFQLLLHPGDGASLAWLCHGPPLGIRACHCLGSPGAAGTLQSPRRPRREKRWVSPKLKSPSRLCARAWGGR